MPATLDITAGVTPPPPLDYGAFGDLIGGSGDAPLSEKAGKSLIGGGTAEAPAFQIVGQKFSEVPRAIAGHLNTDFGPFEDLTKDESMPQLDNLSQEFGMFQDVASAFTPVPETHKAVMDTPYNPNNEQIRATTASDRPLETLSWIGRKVDALLSPGSEHPSPNIISPEVAAYGTHLAGTGARVVSGLLEKMTGLPYKAAEQGIEETVSKSVSDFTNPEGIASLLAFAIPGVADAYAIGVLAKLPEQGGRIKEAIQQHGLVSKETAQAASEAGITDLMGFLAAKGAGHTKFKSGNITDLPQAREGVTKTTEPVAVDQSAAADPLAQQTPETPEIPAIPETPSQRIRRESAEYQAKTDAQVNTILDKSGGQGSVELSSQSQPGHRLLVTPEIGSSEQWRVSQLDENGPYAHVVFDSREAALRATGGESHTTMVNGPRHFAFHPYEVERVQSPLSTAPETPQPVSVTVEGNTYSGATTREALDTARAELAPDMSHEDFLKSAQETDPTFSMGDKPAEPAPDEFVPPTEEPAVETAKPEADLAKEKQLKVHDRLLEILKNCIDKA